MIKHLLPYNKNFYKANLHCHTNLSDAILSPEEVKKAYKEKGYSIVAYTDHDIFITHNDLTDDTFLALNGFEIENGLKENGVGLKTCHICFVALDKDNDIHPLWSDGKYVFANALNYVDKVKFDKNIPPFVREYSPKCMNEIFKRGKENNFFVTYNHPTWSYESYNDYSNYIGMNAMEMLNYGCYVSGYQEYNSRVYDDLLHQDKRIFCIYADDNHNKYPLDDLKSDSFGGFVMIGADSLTYENIAKALKNGDFYSSSGPVISDITFDTELNKVKVYFPTAYRVILTTDKYRNTQVRYNYEGNLTEAEFILKDDIKYFRITLEDKDRKTADSNAYFIEDLKK